MPVAELHVTEVTQTHTHNLHICVDKNDLIPYEFFKRPWF